MSELSKTELERTFLKASATGALDVVQEILAHARRRELGREGGGGGGGGEGGGGREAPVDRDGGSHAVDTEMVTPLEKLVRASDEACMYTDLVQGLCAYLTLILSGQH